MLVVPVYHMVLVPNATLYFQTDYFRRIAGRAVQDEKVVLLLKKEDVSSEEYREDSFYSIGVSGVISEINSNGYIGIRTGSRLNISDVAINPDHTISLEVTKRPDVEDLDPEEARIKLETMKRKVEEVSEDMKIGDMVQAFMEQMASIGELTAGLSIWLKISNEERYEILAQDSVAERTRLMEKAVYEYLEVAKVTNEATTAQEAEYQKMYKEAALKKQMEYLQKELDEMHPENVDDIRRFELAIEEAGMNEDAQREAKKALNRLRQESKNSPESGQLYDYLDFMTSLHWKKEEAKPIDVLHAKQVLDQDHSGLKKVKRRIIQQIAVMNRKQAQNGSILLFVGAPGTGKTSIGKSIAKALGREYVRVSLGGVRDEADIRGHRRTYIGAMPGRIMSGMEKAGVTNPVMVLDEVDKLASSYQGDPAAALLEVLDPEQNSTFTDHYMNVPYDLSSVMFICTANSVDTIPEPLLNRMEVISFNGYTPKEKLEIAKEHLLPKAMEQAGISTDELVVSDEILETIISDYTREAGVRGLRKRMDALCRGAAVMLEEKGEKSVTLHKEDLREELDLRPIRGEQVPEKQKPGIVTGLAWTQVGGTILYIETLFSKGDGKVMITGQLGDVMKESAQLAISLVKSMFPDKADLFKENDLHIHVPEGAVPKDGPSAGITLTTAIASLVTGHAVDSHIAMTGEVSLRGGISAIGGLPEKLMAAQRAGVHTAFIPKENEDDLRDVPEEVKDALTILPVEDVREVLAYNGILEKDIFEVSA